MNQDEMVQGLRAEIAKLQRVLDLLLDDSSGAEERRRPGRPKGSSNKVTSVNPEEVLPKTRTMSPEGKARMAAAQKKRWAAQKAAVPDRVVRKQTPSPKKASKKVSSTSARKVSSTSTAKKSAEAGKRTGSTQRRAATAVTRKIASKKSAAKKTRKLPTKRPVKQMTPSEPEFQTTA